MTLSDFANIAQIATAIVVAGAASRTIWRAFRRRDKLEKYLLGARLEAMAPGGKGAGARTIIRIMGDCSMTEAEVLQAAFSSKNVRHWFTVDEEKHRADGIMFQYDPIFAATQQNQIRTLPTNQVVLRLAKSPLGSKKFQSGSLGRGR